MKITADKKNFIIENQFDKLPSEIIDYIYFFVDNFEPNEKHKNFINGGRGNLLGILLLATWKMFFVREIRTIL